MITTLAALVLAASLDDVAVRARVDDSELVAGSEHAFTVEFVVPEGTSASESGLPSPFLQLDLPAGVTLTEPRSSKGHIDAPEERLMESPSVRVPFVVDESLADDATIGVIVTAYLSSGDDRRFLRERLELPVRAGAEATPGDDADSRWGRDRSLLQIGDTLRGFELPVADGVEPFDLGDIVGKRPVFLTTYRAHW